MNGGILGFILVLIGTVFMFLPDFILFWVGLLLLIIGIVILVTLWFNSNAKKLDNYLGGK